MWHSASTRILRQAGEPAGEPAGGPPAHRVKGRCPFRQIAKRNVAYPRQEPVTCADPNERSESFWEESLRSEEPNEESAETRTTVRASSTQKLFVL